MTIIKRKALASAIVSGMLAASCGDDNDSASDDTVADVAGDDQSSGDTIEIDAVDYGFLGVPETMSAGDMLALENFSEIEVHEIVALRIPDGEERPVEDLIQLSEAELSGVFPDDGPPDVDGGPPHLTEGMFAELTVE